VVAAIVPECRRVRNEVPFADTTSRERKWKFKPALPVVTYTLSEV